MAWVEQSDSTAPHRRVLRFDMPAEGPELELPAGKVVHFAPHVHMASRVEVWVEVDLPQDWPAAEYKAKRFVQIIKTGQVLPPRAKHLATTSTVLTPSARLLLHLYEVDPTRNE